VSAHPWRAGLEEAILEASNVMVPSTKPTFSASLRLAHGWIWSQSEAPKARTKESAPDSQQHQQARRCPFAASILISAWVPFLRNSWRICYVEKKVERTASIWVRLQYFVAFGVWCGPRGDVPFYCRSKRWTVIIINMPSRMQAVGHKVAVHSWPQSVVSVPRIDYFTCRCWWGAKRKGDVVGSAPTLN
jgi:hypothetical protein